MRRKFFVRRNLARFFLWTTRWRTVGSPPPEGGVLVGAPHTSNWDWPITLLLCWRNDIQPKLLVKKELFVGPLGWLMRATGAISLDRKNPRQTVDDLLTAADSSADPFFIALAAEGTRSRGTYWKSGFRRLAASTGLPICLAFVDAPSRTTGWGPVFHPTDDVVADMDIVRKFYADKRGFKPQNATPPLLREEVEPRSSSQS